MPEGLLQKGGNGLLFNLSWLAIVSSQSLWVAIPVVVVHLAVHLAWLGGGMRELRFIAAVAVFGLALDQFLFALGLFQLNGEAALAPLWLGCLWPVLATTLNHAFATLQKNLALAAVLGAAGGAGSYYAGTQMSAVGFASLPVGLVVIAMLWAALFPALALAARHVFAESHGDLHLAS